MRYKNNLQNYNKNYIITKKKLQHTHIIPTTCNISKEKQLIFIQQYLYHLSKPNIANFIINKAQQIHLNFTMQK